MNTDTFFEDFKCPICFEIPQNVIYQCRNGHTICDKCSNRLSACPQCRIPLEASKIRNLVLENILEKTVFDCSFKSKGCVEKIKRNEITRHSENCTFGNTIINFCELIGCTCDYAFNPKKFQEGIKHFQMKHDIKISDKTKINFSMELNLTEKDGIDLWTPIIFDLQKSHKIAWMLVPLIDNESKTFSSVCIQLNEEIMDSGSNRAEFKISGNSNVEIPDQIWSSYLLPIKQARFAVKNPLIQIPLYTLDTFYAENLNLFINCSLCNNVGISYNGTSVIETAQLHFFQPINNISKLGPSAVTQIPQLERDGLEAEPSNKVVRFVDTTCDFCGDEEPVDLDYRCLQCENYDLCKTCMDKGRHDSHVFAVFTNERQEQRFKDVYRTLEGWKSFFPNPWRYTGTDVMARRKFKCSQCNLISKYVCLVCSSNVGYCEFCWTRLAFNHPGDHYFAFANSDRKLRFLHDNI